jgi:hypothetical protein
LTKRRGRRPKLTLAQCIDVRWYYKQTDMSMAAIARRFDSSPGVIAKVIDGKYRCTRAQ